MHNAFTILLLLHGIAHLPGFLLPWGLVTSEDTPSYPTALFNGAIVLGSVGSRVMGVLWLLVGLGCLAAAIFAWRRSPGWPSYALAVIFVSLVLSVIGWPSTAYGVVTNFALIALLILSRPMAATP